MAETTENLLILGFDNDDQGSKNIRDSVVRDLPKIIATDQHFKLFMGKDVDNAIKALGLPKQVQIFRPDDVNAVAERFAADIVVWGRIRLLNPTNFRMSGTLMSQKSGSQRAFSLESSTKSADRQAKLKTEFLDLVSEFAQGEVKTMVNIAIQHYLNNNASIAETQFMRILEINNNNIEAIYYLGRIKYDAKQYAQAIEYFEKGINLDPNHEDLLRFISESYRLQGNIDRSIESLERLADLKNEQNEPDIAIYYNLARNYNQRSAIDKAFEALDQALQINSNFDAGHQLYADIAWDNERYDVAIDHLVYITEKNPDDDETASRLARSYQRTGQLDRAIERHLGVIKNDPRNIRAHRNLAAAYVEKAVEERGTESINYYRLALQTYQETLKIDPSNASIESTIASVYLSLGDLTNTEKYALSALKKQDTLVDAYEILGTVAFKRGEAKYESFAEIKTRYDTDNKLYGNEKDNLGKLRDQTKREAYNFFKMAEKYFKDGINVTESDSKKRNLTNRVNGLAQYLQITAPDFFD